jgi:phosphonopyruvate decarboxylase/sulfopyruvate decarboxylase subunit beta
MMTRSEAIACVLSLLTDELVVAANGMISREAFFHGDREANFYMIGSMGLASAIGLGIAITQPDRRVVVFDGDGNVLMALGTLAIVGELSPPNFVHIVFDNGVYGSTGGQRCISDKINLEKFAEAAGYPRVYRVDTKETLEETMSKMLAAEGPSFLLVKVGPENVPDIPRVPYTPEVIAQRFRAAVGK